MVGASNAEAKHVRRLADATTREKLGNDGLEGYRYLGGRLPNRRAQHEAPWLWIDDFRIYWQAHHVCDRAGAKTAIPVGGLGGAHVTVPGDYQA